MFDIRLSDEQREFRNLARKFAQERIKPTAMALDLEPDWEKRVPWDLLKEGSQLGFRTFVLDEENGGSGMSDHLTACLVAEELAAGELGTAYYFMLTARRARDWFELRATPSRRRTSSRNSWTTRCISRRSPSTSPTPTSASTTSPKRRTTSG